MIGSLIVLEGAGALAYAAVAGAFGVPAAYLLAGVILLAAALAGLTYGRRHPQALSLVRQGSADPARAGG